jgi:hypothetical protein
MMMDKLPASGVSAAVPDAIERFKDAVCIYSNQTEDVRTSHQNKCFA